MYASRKILIRRVFRELLPASPTTTTICPIECLSSPPTSICKGSHNSRHNDHGPGTDRRTRIAWATRFSESRNLFGVQCSGGIIQGCSSRNFFAPPPPSFRSFSETNETFPAMIAAQRQVREMLFVLATKPDCSWLFMQTCLCAHQSH